MMHLAKQKSRLWITLNQASFYLRLNSDRDVLQMVMITIFYSHVVSGTFSKSSYGVACTYLRFSINIFFFLAIELNYFENIT